MRNCSQSVSIVFALTAMSVFAHGGQTGKSKQNSVVRTETIAVHPPVRFEFDDSVGAGRLVKQAGGGEGYVRRTFRIELRDGRRVGKSLLKEERRYPEPVVFHMGRSGYTASRGSYVRHKVFDMVATGYDTSPETIGPGATGRTCTGRFAEYGVVAVDPRVIPLNTIVYVEGYGFALACDRGSAIKGRRIDLCFDSRHVANQYGRRHVRVHVLQ